MPVKLPGREVTLLTLSLPLQNKHAIRQKMGRKKPVCLLASFLPF